MKKLSLLLASVGAGILLVGGTVAAYIVTAAPNKGARITPGSLDADNVGNITLDWGSSTTVSDVSGLQVGVEQTVGTFYLDVSADFDDQAKINAYEGTFKVTLVNTSAVDGKNLLDYLSVKIYDNAVTPELKGTVTKSGDDYVCSLTGKKDNVFVVKASLTSEAALLTEADYAKITGQIVYASFSWGPGANDSDSQNMGTVYFVDTQNWTNHYFFANKDGQGVINKAFPGEEMKYAFKTTISETDYYVYSATFDTSRYDQYIFSDGTNDHKYTVSNVTASEVTNLLNGTAPAVVFGTRTFVAKPTRTLETYYIRGELTNYGTHWGVTPDELDDSLALRVTDGDPFIILDLEEGDSFKIYVPSTNTWVGDGSGENYVIANGKGSNYTICCDNTYHEGWNANNNYWSVLIDNNQ